MLTPGAHFQVSQQSLLAGQVLENLSGRLSHPVYSIVAEGNSNADLGYDYSYKLLVEATQFDLIMEFVFDPLREFAPAPPPLRVSIDEFGNARTEFLSAGDVERVRAETADRQQSCPDQ